MRVEGQWAPWRHDDLVLRSGGLANRAKLQAFDSRTCALLHAQHLIPISWDRRALPRPYLTANEHRLKTMAGPPNSGSAMIDIHLLRYALAAADTGSFRQAADQFRIKQSTLSKHILYLEQRLGLSIFTRSTRGVVPTITGTFFLDRARYIVDDLDALGRETSAIAKGERNTLRIGLGYPLVASELSGALRSYADADPGTAIEATEGSRASLLRGLRTDRIDVAIFPGLSPGPEIRSFGFWSEQVTIAIAADHPLASQDRIYWTDLRACTFLVAAAEPGPDIAQMIRARLSSPGHAPRMETQAVSQESLLPLVSGNRIAVTFGLRPQTGARDGPVFRVPHDAFGPTRLEQGVHWTHRNRSPALTRFLDHLARTFGCAPGDTGQQATEPGWGADDR